MIKKEQINAEVKIGKVVEYDEGKYMIEEYDKDENIIDEITVEELMEIFVGKRYVRVRIDYLADL